jgi:tetratricopeptide (TPR) repeat protein
MTFAEQAQDQARQLVDLCKRAFNSKRPLFILVQYNHEADKFNFINTIGSLAQANDISIRRYDPHHNAEHGATKLYPLLAQDSSDKILSLVVSMPRQKNSDKLATDFLSYINLHRDRIAKQKLHFVLFLRESEMATFIGGASDLWSFRHRTFRLERALEQSTERVWQNVEALQATLTFSDVELVLINQQLENSKQLINETAEHEQKAKLWLDLTLWLERHNALKMAIETALEGIALLNNQGCIVLAELEGELGHVLLQLGVYPEALNHTTIALSLSQQLKNKTLEGTTLNNISQIYHAKGDYDTALEYLKDSLTIRQDIGDKKGEGVTLNNISQIYHGKGDYDTALKYLKDSLTIRQDIGDKAGQGVTLNNISQIYDAKGDYDTALKYLQDSLTISQDIGDKAGEGTTLNNISQIYDAKGDYDTALEYLQDSLTIRQDIGDKKGEGNTLNNISQIYSAKGDDDTALQYLKDSLTISQNIGDKAGICFTLFNIANTHWQKGEHDKAMNIWLSVYQMAKPMKLAQILDALSRTAKTIGLPEGLAGWEKLNQEQQTSL